MIAEAKDIKNVAIYLRKSRGDEEVDLEKHRELLVETAKKNNWSFEEYKEVKSGSSLDDREEMIRLLTDVDTGKFDAVLVFDQDRLSRGDAGDTQRIMWHLRNSGTKIVTGLPFSIVDLENEADIDMFNMKSFFANYEYRQITKRLAEGKKASQKYGLWLYGTPPFGYKYNRDTKRLSVHPEEGEIVLRIVKQFVHMNKSTGEIAWGLNKDGIPSRKSSLWNSKMIRAILIKDVYLGNTTYNKTKGTPLNRAKNKYSIKVPFQQLPENEWRVIHNTHEALMTEHEYNYIQAQFSGKRSPKQTKEGDVFDLSGLCKTPDGRTYTRGDKTVDGHYVLFPVAKYDEMGRYVPETYKMVNSQLVRAAITRSLDALKEEIANNLENNDHAEELKVYKEQLSELEKQHENTLDSFKRINMGYAEGVYTSDEATEMKQLMNEKQEGLETKIREVRRKIDTLSNVKNEDRMERVEKFQRDIKKAENGKELNMLYKSLISYIEVSRTEDRKVQIKVNFL